MYSHECSNPEMPVHQISSVPRMSKALHNTGHEISDDDQVADADTEALDRNRRVKDDSGIGIGDLAEGEETGRATVQVPGAASLKIQSKSRGQTRPAYDEHTQHHAHVRHGMRHRQHSGADNRVHQVDHRGYPRRIAGHAVLLPVSPARGLCGGRARGRMFARLRVDGGVGRHDCSCVCCAISGCSYWRLRVACSVVRRKR